MPVYAYVCKDCGHAFDIRQSFSDDALTECPQCGGTLRKQFNTVGVVFKGSGFYRTDSRSTGSSSDGAATSSADSANTSASPSSSDSAAPSTTASSAAGSATKGSSTTAS